MLPQHLFCPIDGSTMLRYRDNNLFMRQDHRCSLCVGTLLGRFNSGVIYHSSSWLPPSPNVHERKGGLPVVPNYCFLLFWRLKKTKSIFGSLRTMLMGDFECSVWKQVWVDLQVESSTIEKHVRHTDWSLGKQRWLNNHVCQIATYLVKAVKDTNDIIFYLFLQSR